MLDDKALDKILRSARTHNGWLSKPVTDDQIRAALPAFIPIPIGGALSGPLIVLIAAQLLIGLRRPWLPGFIARRGPKRQALARFERIVDPWLGRLEHLVRPRLTAILDHRLATAFTGALLLLLGVLLRLDEDTVMLDELAPLQAPNKAHSCH